MEQIKEIMIVDLEKEIIKKAIKVPTFKRREIIKERILNEGIWDINKGALAKEFNVSPGQITQDWKAAIKDIEPEDLQETTVALSTAHKKVIKELHKALNKTTNP